MMSLVSLVIRRREEVEDEKRVITKLLSCGLDKAVLVDCVLVAAVAWVLRHDYVHFKGHANVPSQLVQHPQVFPVSVK